MKPHSNLLSEERSATLARGESIQVRVQGVSMLPWLREGDAVCIEPVCRRLYRGDIALFWRDPTHPVLHRVVGVRQSGETCIVDCLGDSSYGSPEAVPLDAIIGVARSTPVRRAVYRLLNPARRLFNRVCRSMGVVLRHE